jgi:hypothetical protein
MLENAVLDGTRMAEQWHTFQVWHSGAVGYVQPFMPDDLSQYIPQDILDVYEVHNFRHAAELLASAYRSDFDELLQALRVFRLTEDNILKAGGNESEIPKKLSKLLRPNGWFETQISADLIVTLEAHAVPDENSKPSKVKRYETIERFFDGHKIDYVKNRVAFDLEWNSKDQTFDRDLYAFRTFYECGAIGAAVLLTRSAELNGTFERLGVEVKKKYGASTTWMGKLLPRLKAGRSGGCPVLALGITPRVIVNKEDS